MKTQTQTMSLEDVTNELDLSELEARRAIAQGRLVAMVVNPDSISGDHPKRPKYRVKRSDFESFVGDLVGVRLRPNFLSGGFFQKFKTNNRLGNALLAHVKTFSEGDWLRMARAEVSRRGFRRTGLLSDLQFTLNSVPEVSAAAGEPLINGLAGKIVRQSEALQNAGNIESRNMNLGHAFVVNQAIDSMRTELTERFGRIKGVTLENVYWTREQYESLIASTRKRLVDSHLSLRSRPMKIEAKEGHYSFSYSAHVPLTAIVPRPTIVSIFETVF